MTLRCALHEVAIYIPPDGTSAISADAALAQCRAFLADLVGGEVGDVRVFDDRAAPLVITPDSFWGTRSTGDTPALSELYKALWAGSSYRLVLVADESALGKLPNGNDAERVRDLAQIVGALRVFSQAPSAAKVATLAKGDARAWAELLEPMIYRYVKGPRGARSRVGAPPALVRALLAAKKANAWCALAWEVVAEALPDQGRHMQAQAARHFEEWLMDSIEDALPDKAAADAAIADDDEAEYRKRADAAIAALEEGRWDDAINDALYAQDAGEGLEVGNEARRIELAATFGAGKFNEALEELAPLMLLDAIFGTPWKPTKPVRFIVGIPERDLALRNVTFLLTVVDKLDDDELVDAFDRLQRALDPKQAKALADARAKAVAKKEPNAKKKPVAKKKQAGKKKPKPAKPTKKGR